MPSYFGGKRYRKKGRKRYYKRKWLKAFTKSSLNRHLAFGKSSGEVNIMCQTRALVGVVIPPLQTLSGTIVTVTPGYSNMLGNGEVDGQPYGIAGAFDDATTRKMFASYDQWRVRGVYISVRLGSYLEDGVGSRTTAESVRPYCYWDRSAQYSSVLATNVNSTDVKELAESSGGIPFTKSADKFYSFKCLPKTAAEHSGWLTTNVTHGQGVGVAWQAGVNLKYHWFAARDYVSNGAVGQCVFLPLAQLVFECSSTYIDERKLQFVVETRYYLSFRNPGNVNKSSAEVEYLLSSNDALKPVLA